jgi:hypothetical protein
MRYTISSKLFQLSDRHLQHIERLVEKLTRFGPYGEADEVLLNIIIRRHNKKSLNHIEKRLAADLTVNPIHGHEFTDSPVYYDGTLDFILPKKSIVAKMLGKNVDEALKDGFDELFRELDAYKGLHFPDDSEYVNHSTLRKDGKYFSSAESLSQGAGEEEV